MNCSANNYMKSTSQHLYLHVAALLLLCQVVVAGNGVTRVSGPSPFPAGCDGENTQQKNYENAEVEAWLARDPTNPNHFVGVYQQDRWSGPGCHGVMAAVTRDRGRTWTPSFAHFDRCEGGSASNGGNFARDSDPWVAISPDGGLPSCVTSWSSDYNRGVSPIA